MFVLNFECINATDQRGCFSEMKPKDFFLKVSWSELIMKKTTESEDVLLT